YSQTADTGHITASLIKSGFPDAAAQHFGTSKDVMIRLAPRQGLNSAAISEQVMAVLRADNAEVQLRRVEFVGPQVGEELLAAGALALLFTMVGILIYLWIRFEIRFAVGAVFATLHDPFLILGTFSIFQFEFNLTVVAALLAIIGYSLNDTVVIFDRIRENFRKMRKATPEEVVNSATNQTLSRTIMTSAVTMVAVVALFIFGGELLFGFSLALIVGIVVGTYSSIYIAAATALALGVSKADLMPVEKEGAEQDSRP
ncbi:MAG: protein translocase subunit SecF, partial [Gammaproteobacteria bacterium]|nr:protein translocase subunit SecF [Gammaproteobacteria bacterium]